MDKHSLHWSEVAATVSPAGVERREIAGKGLKMARIVIPAGIRAPRHGHSYEQFVQVLSGSGTLETEQGRVAFAAGSVFHFPPGTDHAAEFDEETVLVETNLGA